MSPSNESTRLVVALMAPRANKPFILFAKAIYGGLLDNPSFPSPRPSLAVFAEHIAALEEAETEAASRTTGATDLRDDTKKTVNEDLLHIRDYVQSVVEATTSPADAAALIKSAFMSVKKGFKRSIPELRAKNADVSGTVTLAAKAVAPTAIYFWEYSLDKSTWTPLKQTMQSRTDVLGLTSESVYHFRFRASTRAGRGDYSQIVSLLVR